MKIAQLNVWMGKVEGNLQRFFEQYDFDVICMQEVMYSGDFPAQSPDEGVKWEESASTSSIVPVAKATYAKNLPSLTANTIHLSRLCFDVSRILRASKMPYFFFSPNWQSRLGDGTFELGNLILSKVPFTSTTFEFVNGEFHTDTILVGKPGNNLNVQIVSLENGITVVNHHGFWRPSPVGDEESVRAFKRLGEVVLPYSKKAPLVLCGDLNVIHDSPAMRALDFLQDLTDVNQVATTLSGLKFDGKVPCDHIMINERISSSNFAVHPDLASDHLAISAEVSVV